MRKFTRILSLLFILLLISTFAFAGESLAIKVVNPAGDFIETGFALAKLEVTLIVGGKPIPEQDVVWKVIAVQSQPEAISTVIKDSSAGLWWGRPYLGTLPGSGKLSKTDHMGVAGVELADIVGERVATIRATTIFNGKVYTAEATAAFGKGPLALLAAPLPEPLTWLELYSICNGEPYSGNPAAWEVGIGAMGGDKMPTLEQLQAISMPGRYNKLPAALGAAIAAGWPHDSRYWDSGAVMKWRAGHVELINGNPHGSGGRDVRAKEYGACLR